MYKQPRTFLFRILGGTVLIGIIIFSYLKYKPIIDGPLLSQISLEPWMVVQTPSLQVTGSVKNTHTIILNGRNLTLDTEELFQDTVALNPGINRIDIRLVDIFGAEKTYEYHVYAEYMMPEFPPTYQEALEQRLPTDESTTEIEPIVVDIETII